MALFKQHQDIETKLYENVYLLTKFYLPTAEFKMHFKRGMFMNKNKAGFFQVVHYLLSVLNPDLTKQKLSSWPPYDIRRESKFRTELIQYVAELNALYDADIPVLMASHLITPGGVKCVKFLHKLSQLVMFQHLNNSSTVKHLLMAPLKNVRSREVVDIYLNKLKTLTNIVEQETRSVHDNFHKMFANMVNNAEKLIEKRSKLNIDLVETTELHQRIMKEHCSHPDGPDLTNISEKIDNLRQALAGTSQVMKIQIEKLEELVTYINEGKNVLVVEKDVLSFPEDIQCIFNSKSDEFDLVKFLNAFHIYLEKMSLHIPVLPSGFLEELDAKLKEINESFSSFDNRVENLHADINKLPERFAQFRVADSVDCNTGDESDLAVPLV